MLDDLPIDAGRDGAVGAQGPLLAAAPRAARAGSAFTAVSLGLFGLALALRFWDLARAPVWMDEAFAYMAAQLPLKTILFGQIDNHPPLFYALQHLWLGLDPRASSMRVPAAIAGSLAVLAVTLAVADLVSRRAGVFAGLFLALSTSQNYFSQDARMYPLLTLGLALAVWGLAGLAKGRERRRHAALYVVGGLVGVYTQAAALIFLASLNLAVLLALAAVRAPRRDFAAVVGAGLVLGLLSLPWIATMAQALGGFQGLRQQPPSTAVWFLASDIGFPGVADWLKKPALLLLASLLLFGAWRAWRAGAGAAAAAGLGAVVLYPLALVAVNVVTPVLEHRVFAPCALGAALLFGAGLAAVRPPGLRDAALAAFLTVAIASLVTEHRARVKPEDLPQALALADQAGFQGAPILTCDFFPAVTTHVTDPRRQVYFMTPSREPMRLDDRFPLALQAHMTALQHATARTYAPYLGDAADALANTAVFQGSDRAVVINAECGSARTTAFLQRLGFVKVAGPELRQPRSVIFSNVWTQLELWRRPVGPQPTTAVRESA